MTREGPSRWLEHVGPDVWLELIAFRRGQGGILALVTPSKAKARFLWIEQFRTAEGVGP